jgi:hypothetical protein
MPEDIRREAKMASIRKEIVTAAKPQAVWDAVRDVGALHTRLVPGFVVDTRLEPDPAPAWPGPPTSCPTRRPGPPAP